ncbi:MAG: YihY/virulence factor BrkB family protein [Anaerolineales bacterium]|nr:YihY/virulence factor BrkB family protein [Anaerolineales bacterium]
MNEMIILALINWSRNIVNITADTFKRFAKERAHLAAATFAYYTLFSIFPLLMFLVFLASLVIDPQDATTLVVNWLSTQFPTSFDSLVGNISDITQNTRTLNVPLLLGLTWSASGMFNTLAVQINLAWPQANRRSIISQRLVAYAMIGILVLLIFLSLLLSTVSKLIPWENLAVLDLIHLDKVNIVKFMTRSAPIVLRFILITMLYYYVPNTKVYRLVAIMGAVIVNSIWELITMGFTFYLNFSFNRYNLVYGSLGTIMVSLFWIYLIGWVLIFGSYLTSAMNSYGDIIRNPYIPPEEPIELPDIE